MSLVSVRIHSSQFPENVRRDLIHSLEKREINHKFHYDSIKQTQKWLALHQAYSPSRTDSDCDATYAKSFVDAAKRIRAQTIHLIGLGCGGGQKDSRLLKLLKGQGKELFYTPSDVSVAMVLVAEQAASAVVSRNKCFPFVCDLASDEDLAEIFSAKVSRTATRLFTFFGMIPNFEPQVIVPKLAALLRRNDLLLFSANLAPGKNYSSGVERILPLYENELTREWLITFLTDLGIETRQGKTRFVIEDHPVGNLKLKRIAAYFQFSRRSVIDLPERRFEFRAGEQIRLFFSYRHTTAGITRLLGKQGISVLDQWITQSEEEGVFLCRKSG